MSMILDGLLRNDQPVGDHAVRQSLSPEGGNFHRLARESQSTQFGLTQLFDVFLWKPIVPRLSPCDPSIMHIS